MEAPVLGPTAVRIEAGTCPRTLPGGLPIRGDIRGQDGRNGRQLAWSVPTRCQPGPGVAYP